MAQPSHIADSYLLVVNFPGTLYRAIDVGGLIQAASDQLDCSPWVLIRPASDHPIYVDVSGRHDVDALSAGQIAALARSQFPTSTVAGTIHPVWGVKLVELLDFQFDVSGTTALAVVWASSHLLAAIGLRPRFNPGMDAAESVHVLADAYRHLHEIQAVREERSVYRTLSENIQEALVVVVSTGTIAGITPSAVEILHTTVHGRTRPNAKDPLNRVPSVLVQAIRKGVTTVVLTQEITASLSYPAAQGDTVEPHAIIRLAVNETCANEALEVGIRSLTPGQRAVYRLLLEGQRSKEIAAELSISEHTVRHHITAVLQKTQCMDKIQLITRVGKLPKREPLTAPPMVTALVPPDMRMPSSKQKKGTALTSFARE